MASISTDAQGRRTIQFIHPADRKRRSIRLGKTTERDAERIRVRVEELVNAALFHQPLHNDTADWLASIGAALAAKLANAGLAAPRTAVKAPASSLADYVANYRAHRTDVSVGTSTNYQIVGARLLAFLKPERMIHTIAECDADRWLVWLKNEYARPTVSKSIKVARQFWAQAMRDGLVMSNPFAHLKTPSEVNTARAHFVDRATFARVIEACPDHQWRLLLALSRYGGLRTPSEPLTLTWDAISWERQRFRVVAPKTKLEDGGERWVPLFPELLPFLEEAFDLAQPEVLPIITRYRETNANLRTQFGRILRRAGVKAWPRLFQNLRASRETELCERFPIHVVAEWLGNSPKTALAHYTQTTEDHYRRAVGEASALHNPVQSGVAGSGLNGPNKGKVMPDEQGELLQDLSGPCLAAIGSTDAAEREVFQMTLTGFEPVSRP